MEIFIVFKIFNFDTSGPLFYLNFQQKRSYQLFILIHECQIHQELSQPPSITAGPNRKFSSSFDAIYTYIFVNFLFPLCILPKVVRFFFFFPVIQIYQILDIFHASSKMPQLINVKFEHLCGGNPAIKCIVVYFSLKEIYLPDLSARFVFSRPLKIISQCIRCKFCQDHRTLPSVLFFSPINFLPLFSLALSLFYVGTSSHIFKCLRCDL